MKTNRKIITILFALFLAVSLLASAYAYLDDLHYRSDWAYLAPGGFENFPHGLGSLPDNVFVWCATPIESVEGGFSAASPWTDINACDVSFQADKSAVHVTNHSPELGVWVQVTGSLYALP